MIHIADTVDCKYEIKNLHRSVIQVSTFSELEKVREFRKRVYSNLYPEITNFGYDPFDEQSIIFYHTDQPGQIAGTLRCCLDSSMGLPDEKLFVEKANLYRTQGLSVAEAGRTAVKTSFQTTEIIKALYGALYQSVKQLNIDVVFICVPQKKVQFHMRIWDAEVLNYNTGQTFGSSGTFSALAWHVSKTKPRFYKWIDNKKGIQKSQIKENK